MKEKSNFDPEATRLAKVNPATGVEIKAGASHRRVSSAYLDKTVLHGDERREPPVKKTTEVIPVTGARGAGEDTSLWQQKKRRLVLSNLFQWKGNHVKLLTRRKLALLALAPIVLGLALVPWGKEQSDPPQVPSIQPSMAEATEFQESTVENKPAFSKEEPSVVLKVASESAKFDFGNGDENPGRSADLGAAVAALLDGRLDEARVRYAALAKALPEDESVRLAWQILSRIETGGQ